MRSPTFNYAAIFILRYCAKYAVLLGIEKLKLYFLTIPKEINESCQSYIDP